LRSVTVTGSDTALAEVWSKALLVAGRRRIAGLTRRHDLAAFWVEDDGQLGCSPALRPAVLWTAGSLHRH
jgi:thiamine biosynthesis lipoprotein ApbE